MEVLKTEINQKDDDDNDKKFFYKGAHTSDISHYKSHSSFDLFLDYTFRQKKNLIYKEKNKTKLLNYSYELEQTISLNLEILLSYLNSSNSKSKNKKQILISNDNKSRDTAESSSSISISTIIQLVKTIKEKVKKKSEINKNIHNLISKINGKIDENKKYNLKIKEDKIKFKQKISKNNNILDNMDNYIIVMNKKFYKIQKHVDNLLISKKNQILNSNKRNIFDFLYLNISYNKKFFNIKKDIKNYLNEVNEMKIDNNLYKEEKKLYRNKKNTDLIRCMEFYRRINSELYFKLKIVKKQFAKFIKIMEFLNLGNIAQFTIKKTENESNFEIEFSKISKESGSSGLFPKMNRNLNFSINFDD